MIYGQGINFGINWASDKFWYQHFHPFTKHTLGDWQNISYKWRKCQKSWKRLPGWVAWCTFVEKNANLETSGRERGALARLLPTGSGNGIKLDFNTGFSVHSVHVQFTFSLFYLGFCKRTTKQTVSKKLSSPQQTYIWNVSILLIRLGRRRGRIQNSFSSQFLQIFSPSF